MHCKVSKKKKKAQSINWTIKKQSVDRAYNLIPFIHLSNTTHFEKINQLLWKKLRFFWRIYVGYKLNICVPFAIQSQFLPRVRVGKDEKVTTEARRKISQSRRQPWDRRGRWSVANVQTILATQTERAKRAKHTRAHWCSVGHDVIKPWMLLSLVAPSSGGSLKVG